MSTSTSTSHFHSTTPAQSQRDCDNGKVKDVNIDLERSFGVGIALVQGNLTMATQRSNRLTEEHIYENFQPAMANKRYLLHKYFRRAATIDAPIYENLCRGCGYGVFEARGQLCHFCQYIVSGGLISEGESQATKIKTCHNVDGIYENICGRCRGSYNEKDMCKCAALTTTEESIESTVPLTLSAKTFGLTKVSTEQISLKSKLSDKLYKSKSFVKREKSEFAVCSAAAGHTSTPSQPFTPTTGGGSLTRNIFYNLFGSLKQINRILSASSASSLQRNVCKGSHKKSLEIIHNVEGYENVFRTQETFDLQRICELKRTQTSYSDHHIYGKLKCKNDCKETAVNETESTATAKFEESQKVEQLLKHDRTHDLLLLQEPASLPTETRFSKRPRISRVRLLRSLSNVGSNRTAPNFAEKCSKRDTFEPLEITALPLAATSKTSGSQLSLYLNESICQWMTSLRYDIHGYDDDAVAASALEQQPKSVPAARYLRICAQQPSQLQPKVVNGHCDAVDSDDEQQDEFVTLRRREKRSREQEPLSTAHIKEKMDEEELKKFISESAMYGSFALTPAELMIMGFKHNLVRRIGKQKPQQVRKTSVEQESIGNLATATITDSHPQENVKKTEKRAIYVRNVVDEATDLMMATTITTTTATFEHVTNDVKQQPTISPTVARREVPLKNLLTPIENVQKAVSNPSARFANCVLEEVKTIYEQMLISNNKIMQYSKSNVTKTQNMPNIIITGKNCVQFYSDFFQMINNIFLSATLNANGICYDKTLSIYLRVIQERERREHTNVDDAKERITKSRKSNKEFLLRKYKRFYFYCQHQQHQQLLELGAVMTLTQTHEKSVSNDDRSVEKNEVVDNCDNDDSDFGVSSTPTFMNAHDSVSCMTPLSADNGIVECERRADNYRVECVATQTQLHVDEEYINVNVVVASDEVAKSGSESECVNVAGNLIATIMNETDASKTSEIGTEIVKTTTNHINYTRKPPKVPQRDPKTTLTTITKTSALATANNPTKSIIKTKLPNSREVRNKTKLITTSPIPTTNAKTVAMIQTIPSKSVASTIITAKEEEVQINTVKLMTVPHDDELNANTSTQMPPTQSHTKVTTQQQPRREAKLEEVTNNNNNSTMSNKNNQDEEDIYQPIWKFQTVGEAQEDYDVEDAVAECSDNDDDSDGDDGEDFEDIDAAETAAVDAAAVAAAVAAVDDVLEGIVIDDDDEVDEENDDIKNDFAGYETLKAAALAAAGARQKSSLTSTATADSSKRAAMRAAVTSAAVIIASDLDPVDDQCDWETDDEFMFATQLEDGEEREPTKSAISSDTLRSTKSYKSSMSSGSVSEGSTITNFGSSTATLASIGEEIIEPATQPILPLTEPQHQLMSLSRRASMQGKRLTASAGNVMDAALLEQARRYRNVGLYYSISDQKVRAIVYDYDRLHASEYFASRVAKLNAKARAQLLRSAPPPPTTTLGPGQAPSCSLTPSVKIELVSEPGGTNDSGIGRQKQTSTSSLPRSESDVEDGVPMALKHLQQRAPMPPPRTTSVLKKSESSTKGAVPSCHKRQLLPDSVQAWKFLLLDVNYVEDEEDLIVSTSEIQRAQQVKEDTEVQQTQQLNILTRFKSASIGNLADLPREDDKKSLAEWMRFKMRGGVFKIHMRSPKSDKKSRVGFFRRPEASSLYLEDGLKAKYPIFGASLEAMDLNVTTQPNVPRFVIDVVEYIEQPECIIQDGLYRASGNKVCIDELKQKLCESYIYDPRWLRTDDIHTLTSLNKQFFRELGTPLIPQASYERLGTNLSDEVAIETMRIVFDEMREPNRSTLRYLIKHLTNVAAQSLHNRMPASNLAIVWGPCLLAANQLDFDIGRMNMLAKVLIENYDRIFVVENERLVS